MYFTRKIEKQLDEALKHFPACLITGARQSGKSTLLQHFLKDYTYLNLDDPFLRQQAIEDPKLFLSSYKTPVIIDEIQYAPELLSYIKIEIDKNRRKYGQYVLTGSQVFSVMANISESLAGRIAIFNLYPFSFKELSPIFKNSNSIDEQLLFKIILQGFYPEFYVQENLNPNMWHKAYLTTYIERDVRKIKNINDLNLFQKFIQLLAIRTGQILNISEIAKDCGISSPTAKNWLSILESSYIIYLLKPFHNNRSKRIIKSPKIYFVDTGLLCYLLSIDNFERLIKISEKGHIFENMIISEVLKQTSYQSKKIDFYFYRTTNGLEVDLIISKEGKIIPFEIKFSKTLNKKYISSLSIFMKEYNIEKGFLISLENKKVNLSENISNIYWNLDFF